MVMICTLSSAHLQQASKLSPPPAALCVDLEKLREKKIKNKYIYNIYIFVFLIINLVLNRQMETFNGTSILTLYKSRGAKGANLS